MPASPPQPPDPPPIPCSSPHPPPAAHSPHPPPPPRPSPPPWPRRGPRRQQRQRQRPRGHRRLQEQVRGRTWHEQAPCWRRQRSCQIVATTVGRRRHPSRFSPPKTFTHSKRAAAASGSTGCVLTAAGAHVDDEVLDGLLLDQLGKQAGPVGLDLDASGLGQGGDVVSLSAAGRQGFAERAGANGVRSVPLTVAAAAAGRRSTPSQQHCGVVPVLLAASSSAGSQPSM